MFYSDNQTEIGGGCLQIGKHAIQYFLAFAAPQFGPHKIYAYLGKASSQDEEALMLTLY